MNLLRTIFWIVLFVASTFCFLVVFEYGFSGGFAENCKKEVAGLKKVFGLADSASKANAVPK
jgi:hypothetical protein